MSGSLLDEWKISAEEKICVPSVVMACPVWVFCVLVSVLACRFAIFVETVYKFASPIGLIGLGGKFTKNQEKHLSNYVMRISTFS